MRIGLNLLSISPRIGGGYNYVASILKALASQRHNDVSFVAFANEQSVSLVPKDERFEVVNSKVATDSRISSLIYENIFLEDLAKKYKIDLLHWFSNLLPVFPKLPSVLTIHDLLMMRETKSYKGKLHIFFLRRMLKQSVRKANHIFPVSNCTLKELASFFCVGQNKMTVVPCPIQEDLFYRQPDSLQTFFRQKYNLPGKYWLYVAHFYPHKNHVHLIKAYSNLVKSSGSVWKMVLRGDDHGSLAEVLKLVSELGIREHVIFLPRIPLNELPILYSSASALVFPSNFEGGGIPIMEAMACECPVLGSKIPTNFEFGEDAILYFDQNNVEDIYNHMLFFKENEQIGLNLVSKGKKIISKQNLLSIGEKLISGYRQTLNN